MKKMAKDMIPGSAIAEDAMKKAEALGLRVSQDAARKALINTLKSGGASKEEVESKLSDFKSTHNMK